MRNGAHDILQNINAEQKSSLFRRQKDKKNLIWTYILFSLEHMLYVYISLKEFFKIIISKIMVKIIIIIKKGIRLLNLKLTLIA